MSTLLKDIYSPAFFTNFSEILSETVPFFQKNKFTRLIFTPDWETKELKQRMRHISGALHHLLPADFGAAMEVVHRVIDVLKSRRITASSLEFMFFPDYIETYGIDHFEQSVHSIELVTQFTSCEFAVRPFLNRYGARMIEQMKTWSLHENLHVRRLASEGSRPRLPWAMAVPLLKKDPSPILPILENLKTDLSEYVRRSVANSLNDIARDHPAIVISIAKNWRGLSKETDAVIRHGCRTLLKRAHPEVLNFYGLQGSDTIRVSGFKLLNPVVKTGNSLVFTFNIHNRDKLAKTIRIEYALYYLMANGKFSRKVFKVSERIYQPNEKCVVQRKQSFKPITTRRFYPGQHKLAIIVNGREEKAARFTLSK